MVEKGKMIEDMIGEFESLETYYGPIKAEGTFNIL